MHHSVTCHLITVKCSRCQQPKKPAVLHSGCHKQATAKHLLPTGKYGTCPPRQPPLAPHLHCLGFRAIQKTRNTAPRTAWRRWQQEHIDAWQHAAQRSWTAAQARLHTATDRTTSTIHGMADKQDTTPPAHLPAGHCTLFIQPPTPCDKVTMTADKKPAKQYLPEATHGHRIMAAANRLAQFVGVQPSLIVVEEEG